MFRVAQPRGDFSVSSVFPALGTFPIGSTCCSSNSNPQPCTFLGIQEAIKTGARTDSALVHVALPLYTTRKPLPPKNPHSNHSKNITLV